MAERLDPVTLNAITAFDASLDGCGHLAPDKLEIAMIYIHKLVKDPKNPLSRYDFMAFAGSIIRLFDEREMRAADLDRRLKKLDSKGYMPKGKPCR